MIGNIRINVNRSVEEMQIYLRKHKVTIKTKFGDGTTFNEVVFNNLNDPDNFKLELQSAGGLSPWYGKCKLIPQDEGRNSFLFISMRPPKAILYLFSGFILFILYTIISASLKNSDEPWFLISIIVPLLAVSFVVLLWFLIAQFNANRLKKRIVASFDSYVTVL